MRERLPLLGGLALLAIAFVIGAVAIGHGIRDRNRNDVIIVTGSAKKRITSDYVIWGVSVTSQQASATAAAKELDRWTTAIRSFMNREGVEPAELVVQPISTGTLSKGGRVTAYKLTRRFELRSRVLRRSGSPPTTSSGACRSRASRRPRPPRRKSWTGGRRRFARS